jgi:hypothetical protein
LAEQKAKAREKRIQKKARQEVIAAQKEKEEQKKAKMKKARELANQKKPVLQKKHITRQVTQAAKENAPPDPVVEPAPEPDSPLSPQILALGKDSENEADDSSSEYSFLSSDSEDDFSIISSISDSETPSDCDSALEGNSKELMMLEQDTNDNPPDEVRSFTSQTPAQGSSGSDDPYNLSSPNEYVLTETDDKIVDWLSENVDSQTSLESAIESANRAVEYSTLPPPTVVPPWYPRFPYSPQPRPTINFPPAITPEGMIRMKNLIPSNVVPTIREVTVRIPQCHCRLPTCRLCQYETVPFQNQTAVGTAVGAQGWQLANRYKITIPPISQFLIIAWYTGKIPDYPLLLFSAYNSWISRGIIGANAVIPAGNEVHVVLLNASEHEVTIPANTPLGEVYPTA